MSDSDFFDLPIRLHAVNGVHIAARVGGDGRRRPSPDQRHLASPVADTDAASHLRGRRPGDSDKPAARRAQARHGGA